MPFLCVILFNDQFSKSLPFNYMKILQVGCQVPKQGNYYLNNNSNYTLLMHILNTMLLLFSPLNPFLYPRKYFFRRRWWNLMSELPKLLCIASRQSVFQRTMYEKIIVHFERIFYLWCGDYECKIDDNQEQFSSDSFFSSNCLPT